MTSVGFQNCKQSMLIRELCGGVWSFPDHLSLPPDRINTVCAPVGGDVPVPCPESAAEELQFDLLRDGEIIYNSTCFRLACGHQRTRAGVEVRRNADNKSVGFVLTGVNASSHGLYRCEGTVKYPPPLVSVPSDRRVLVLIEGKNTQKVLRFQNKGLSFLHIKSIEHFLCLQ